MTATSIKTTQKGGDRAIRSARIKLRVLSATLRLIGHRSFRDLHVSEICKEAGISKVTFFNYFPQKEDVLLYYMRVWAFNRSVELRRQGRKGIEGIYFLAERLADTYDKNRGLVLSVLSYWTSDNRPPQTFPLKIMERRILYPGKQYASEIDILTIPQMLEKFLIEAMMSKEINEVSDSRDLTNLFLSILYGGLITAHMQQLTPVRLVLRKHIDMTLKGLQRKVRLI